MNIDEALKKIGEITEKALKKNPDAISWDDEINIKRSMVNSLNLEKYFKDPVALENMYIYEMFDDKFKIPHKKKLEMIKFYIMALPKMTDIGKVNIDSSKIK